jgi:hypothetical protein
MARPKDPAERISIKVSIISQLDKTVEEILLEYLANKQNVSGKETPNMAITGLKTPSLKTPTGQENTVQKPFFCTKDCSYCQRFDDHKRCYGSCHIR